MKTLGSPTAEREWRQEGAFHHPSHQEFKTLQRSLRQERLATEKVTLEVDQLGDEKRPIGSPSLS
jgi:hypothetical protein